MASVDAEEGGAEVRASGELGTDRAAVARIAALAAFHHAAGKVEERSQSTETVLVSSEAALASEAAARAAALASARARASINRRTPDVMSTAHKTTTGVVRGEPTKDAQATTAASAASDAGIPQTEAALSMTPESISDAIRGDSANDSQMTNTTVPFTSPEDNVGDDATNDKVIFVKTADQLYPTLSICPDKVYTSSAYHRCMMHTLFRHWKFGASGAQLVDNGKWVLFECDWVSNTLSKYSIDFTFCIDYPRSGHTSLPL